MLDDTLVVWGGEFGRTNYSQGKTHADGLRRGSSPAVLHDVDGWRGVRPGPDIRETDPFAYNVVRDPVHVHDVHATISVSLGSTMNN